MVVVVLALELVVVASPYVRMIGAIATICAGVGPESAVSSGQVLWEMEKLLFS